MTTHRYRSGLVLVLVAAFVSAVFAAETWKTIASFNGSGTANTATFTTHGGNVRFEFTVEPNSSGPVPLLLEMYSKAGAHPPVRVQCIDCKGPQTKDAGKVSADTYYLRVTTSRPWTLKVEERQ